MDPDLIMRGDLAFHVNVVATGAVLGAAPSHAPDDVTARLGAAFAENRIGACVWRDYGAVEFFWERSPGSTGYRATHFSIQVHQLDNDPEQMNGAVRRVYGGFPCGCGSRSSRRRWWDVLGGSSWRSRVRHGMYASSSTRRQVSRSWSRPSRPTQGWTRAMCGRPAA